VDINQLEEGVEEKVKIKEKEKLASQSSIYKM